jgi:hypothetical protein
MACMLAILFIGGCAANSPIAGRGVQAVATKSIVDDELERLRIWHQQHPQQEQPRERAYARIVQIIDNDNALVLLNPGSEYGRQLVWLTGFPTEGLVDDQLLGGHIRTNFATPEQSDTIRRWEHSARCDS